MSDKGELVELVVTRFIRETAAAHLVLLEDTGEQVWFPKSHIEDIDHMDDGTGTILVTEWIANAKGLL